MNKIQKGFTLIELMIVVAIIAILASIALPAYQDYTIRSQVAEGPINASGLKSAVVEYYVNRGAFPATNALAGFIQPITGTYVAGVVNTAGVIVVTYGNNANSKIAGSTLAMVASVNANGDIAWVCGNRATPSGFTVVGAAASSVLTKYRAANCRP